jgi:gliding motility-associated-like protein
MSIFNKCACLFIFWFLFVVKFGWSQSTNIPPTITATGNQAYCPLSEINIVTDFDIVDPDDTEIEALYIQISTGYEFGFDLLTLNGSHPNVITSWNVTEGKLTLKGINNIEVPYVDLIAAVKDVVFRSTRTNPVDKFFSFTIGDANYLPSTGHYYEYVPSTGITWTNAKVEAENRTYFGLQGYLATITSEEEAKLTGEQALGTGWIGGSDEETEGVWKWLTGPEAGKTFWFGMGNGTTVGTDFPYANWNYLGNEPNNLGNEDYAHIVSPNLVNSNPPSAILGSWNDLPNIGGNGDYASKGYIVEYGGMPGDPTLNLSASTQIYVPQITNTVSNSICGSGNVVLEAYASSATATILWFDSLTGGVPIANGNTFTTPNINLTNPYYVLASENGCEEGSRVPVLANVIEIPTIVSVTDNVVCDTASGTLSASPSAGVVNWYDRITGGNLLATGNSFVTPNLNMTTTYYVDATENGCTSPTRTPVTLTVQKTPIPTANVNQSFCDIDNALISDLSITGSNILWYQDDVSIVPLDLGDVLSNKTYYATQTINGCESQLRLPIDVIIYETVAPPDASNIPIMETCDSLQNGSDTNGFSVFDLTLNEAILLNGKSATDYSFIYFTDPAYSVFINNPSSFINTIPFTQSIFVRIENNLDNSCYVDTAFDIVVNALPIIQQNIVFKNCDEDGVPDGFTDFNLNEANDIIANNNSIDLNFTHYLNVNDADTKQNAINSSSYNNTLGNTVFARVENDQGCYRISTINLQVATTDFPAGYLHEIQNCDADNVIDGFSEFDLTQASSLFISQFPTGQNLSVHYYRNNSDAQLELNEITNIANYTNETSFSQLLYVRVESSDNGDCFGLGPHLLLTVNPRPEFEVDNSAIYCLDNNPITLTTFNPKGNYTYQWTDASGQVLSNNPEAIVASGGEYTVIATSNFGCTSFPISFTVVESAIADISMEDITIVELSNNNSITINNDNNNLGIGDYEFALDDINGPYKDEPFFDNVGAGLHIVYVKDKNLCGIAEQDVFILGFPKFFTPNNDGNNDIWRVKGLGNTFSNSSVVNIFDRFGKLIKQLNAKDGIWDGTFNGQPLAVSDYWFVAELIETSGKTRIYRGHFSLVR